MNLEALKEAITRRKGKGLEELLALLLGSGAEGKEEGASLDQAEGEELEDLAPDVKDEGAGLVQGEDGEEEGGDAGQGKMLIAEMLDQYGKSPMREGMKAMKKKA